MDPDTLQGVAAIIGSLATLILALKSKRYTSNPLR